jgi:hypothetical protein
VALLAKSATFCPVHRNQPNNFTSLALRRALPPRYDLLT